MKKSLIALAAMAAAGVALGRSQTNDISFGYRMGAGFPGDVNRTHPASIVPGLMDINDPIPAYGQPCLVDVTDNSYRAVIATDDAITAIAGVLVRPYPTQQTTGGMSSAIGAAAPPATGVVDVLEDGFILVRLSDFAAHAPVKGGDVFIWTAVASGNHVLGGFEAAATGGSSTLALTNAEFNGPCDADGICEIRVWKAVS